MPTIKLNMEHCISPNSTNTDYRTSHVRKLSESESHSTTDRFTPRELLDFSYDLIPGLYQVTADDFFFEYTDSSTLSKAKAKRSVSWVSAVFKEEKSVCYGLKYFGYVLVKHRTGEEFRIYLPEEHSYDPLSGYFSQEHFHFLVLFAASEIKACCSGVDQQELSYIYKSLKPIINYYRLQFYCEWMHTQILNSVYQKILSPSYPHFLISKIMARKLLLGKNNHAKEYLDKCLKFDKQAISEVEVPKEYFQMVLHKKVNRSFELKMKYYEIESKETPKSLGESGVLNSLGKVAPEMNNTEKGRNYKDLLRQTRELNELYTQVFQTIGLTATHPGQEVECTIM